MHRIHRARIVPSALAGALVTVTLLAGCSADPIVPPTATPIVSQPATPTATPSGPPPATGTALPQQTDPPASEISVRCGASGELIFPASALAGPGTGEQGADPVAAALREYLAGPQADPGSLPRTGWHRVIDAPDGTALFVARHPSGIGWVQVGIQLGGGENNNVVIVGQCRLSVIPPTGTSTGSWSLDPAFPGPGPADSILHVLVQEIVCAGGRPPADRVRAPIVALGADDVTLTFFIDELAGGQDCQGAPPSPIEVTLTEPLGERVLRDGGTFPPTLIGR